MRWIRITNAENVPEREGRVLSLGSRPVALFNLGDRFVALENRCPHGGGPLADGIVGGTSVTCPLHNWRVCLDTGAVTKPCDGAKSMVEIFPVKVVDGIILLGIEEPAGRSIELPAGNNHMTIRNKANRISLLKFSTPQMRAFHMSWLAFFLCFFGWFGIAPLMPVVREELHLTKSQIGNTIIASVAVTIFARLLFGWLCDRIGPRKSYGWLLVLGSLPVMGIGLSKSYLSFLIFRLAIGAIGASFVVTQYHTSVMFAPNVVGSANAIAAGWGNLGGGVTQMVMPLLYSTFLGIGVGSWWGWRLAMIVPGVALMLMGIAYSWLTVDTPDGSFTQLRAAGLMRGKAAATGAFAEACRDPRVWALFAIYGACFGVELTIDNIAALYFVDYFHLGLKPAGVLAGTFGLMNLFARALGGIVSDRCCIRWGMRGRALFLGVTLCLEGAGLLLFSRATLLPLAVLAMLVTGLFLKMSNGATYSVVPFVNKRALGAVAGIVGAGGNFGAVLAGLLFKNESIPWPQAILILGVAVMACSGLVFLLRFQKQEELAANEELHARLADSIIPILASGD